jgi:hypothetical protein
MEGRKEGRKKGRGRERKIKEFRLSRTNDRIFFY